MITDYLWVEKYRPRKIDDLILPEHIKETFKAYVADGNIPNLLLAGGAGIGKTTMARAALAEMGADHILINGSLDRGIDLFKEQVLKFATAVSLTTGTRKYVILDEADNLTTESQKALRAFMEEHSTNCGFILTCNYKQRLIAPLHSRCAVIEFSFSNKEKKDMIMPLFRTVCDILTNEQVSFQQKAVAKLIDRYFPDFRRVVGECQRLAKAGAVTVESLSNVKYASVADAVALMKAKNFTKLREWMSDNQDMDHASFYEDLYREAAEFLKPHTIPILVVHIAKYQYQHGFVANPEINMMACLTEIMLECEFA